MKSVLVASFFIAWAGASWADQPDLSDLIDDTVGYVNIADGIVLMEGDTMGSYICKIEFRNSAFDLYEKNGELRSGDVGYSCIPVEESEK